MDFTLNDFFLQQIPKLINIGAEHSDTRKCIWAAKQSGGTCRSSFKLCYLRSYCDEACGLAHSSHVWTVIMWCHSCAWSLHSGINQPWAAYRQINASAGGQDGAADWQLILSVSRKLRRNRTASLCKPSRWDFMTFLGMTLPTRCQNILRAYANPTLQVNVNFPGYVWSKEMTRFRACWKYDEPAIQTTGVRDGGQGVPSAVSRWWFPVSAHWRYDLKQLQRVTHRDPNIIPFFLGNKNIELWDLFQHVSICSTQSLPLNSCCRRTVAHEEITLWWLASPCGFTLQLKG